ncbi:MAG: tRNA lysidine(34) synthetase TilS [Chlamydiia bacterium]|nr:tRNA lysidine(34) synthetase TilS [Chlamydiia bacterium]
MREVVERFLAEHYRGGTVLLGLSGGPDSLALAHVFAGLDVPWQVAHVDHGWREESCLEAKQIAAWAEEWGVKCHQCRLEGECGELGGRERRLQFFQEVIDREGLVSVILGHHADDQAETILKRVLEGAPLVKLVGMEEVSSLHGLPLWRPFLRVGKGEILDFVAQEGLHPFDDVTNRDCRYLRARMREVLLPHIEEIFGKKVGKSLLRLSEEAKLLRNELVFPPSIEGKWGIHIDLKGVQGFALRQAVRRVERGMSHSIVDAICLAVEKGKANQRYGRLFVDRGSLFLLKQENFLASQAASLLCGQMEWGEWSVRFAPVTTAPNASGWRDLWRGAVTVRLPKGEYTLEQPSGSARYLGSKTLSEWWTDHKVPAFLRGSAPVLCQGGVVVHEFLTGKQLLPAGGWEIELKT